jgi:hypothetical protein
MHGPCRWLATSRVDVYSPAGLWLWHCVSLACVSDRDPHATMFLGNRRMGHEAGVRFKEKNLVNTVASLSPTAYTALARCFCDIAIDIRKRTAPNKGKLASGNGNWQAASGKHTQQPARSPARSGGAVAPLCAVILVVYSKPLRNTQREFGV